VAKPAHTSQFEQINISRTHGLTDSFAHPLAFRFDLLPERLLP